MALNSSGKNYLPESKKKKKYITCWKNILNLEIYF